MNRFALGTLALVATLSVAACVEQATGPRLLAATQGAQPGQTAATTQQISCRGIRRIADDSITTRRERRFGPCPQ